MSRLHIGKGPVSKIFESVSGKNADLKKKKNMGEKPRGRDNAINRKSFAGRLILGRLT